MTARHPRAHRISIACGLAAMVVAAALAPRIALSADTSVCANKAPKSLDFNRKVGKRYGRLSWHGSGAKNRRYRVFRNGAIVGQTFHRSMRVAVRPGATYQFAVRPLTASGGESVCAGELMEQLSWYP